MCAENSDCVSKVCNTEWAEAGEGFCARATCSDQKRNGDEVRPVDVLVRGAPWLVSNSRPGGCGGVRRTWTVEARTAPPAG